VESTIDPGATAPPGEVSKSMVTDEGKGCLMARFATGALSALDAVVVGSGASSGAPSQAATVSDSDRAARATIERFMTRSFRERVSRRSLRRGPPARPRPG